MRQRGTGDASARATCGRSSLRIELIDCAVVVCAPVHGGAEEVTRAVIQHAVIGILTVRRSRETVHHILAPVAVSTGHKLENHAVGCRAAFTRGAVDVARAVEIHATNRARTIAAAETVEHLLLPLASAGGELIDAAD